MSHSIKLWLSVAAVIAAALLTVPAGAGAHAERQSFFPDPNQGDFPVYRTDGTSLIVCAPDSRTYINRIQDNNIRRDNNRLLSRCRIHNIQVAVDRARNNYRIQILPGHYRELLSRRPPPPGCEGIYDKVANGQVLSYDEQRQCPNAQNLIAVLGDTDGNGICDSKCNLQIEGTGDSPDDVVIFGDRSVPVPQNKLNLLRADRADGIYIRNMKFQFSDFNNVYVLETNGFRIDSVISAYSREYGILSFTSDHGIYENCEAYGNGDSGVYPGSGPDARHGQPDARGLVYGIVIRNCDSHDNVIGSSGTAGNGTWMYHNRFHNNGAGITTDSFASGHPGMPQDSSKWSENLIYSNNRFDLFADDRDQYCKQPSVQRDPRIVCPTFQVPVGTGMLIAGGNNNVVANNYIFDNWRNGTMLFWVPATLRGESDNARNYDTSGNNMYTGNCMSTHPAVVDPAQVDFSQCLGTRDSNGTDHWWDEEEGQDCDPNQSGCVDTDTTRGNCWSGNLSTNGGAPSSNPNSLLMPGCPGNDLFRPGNSEKQAFLVPCATWDPTTNTDPPGCDWFTPQPEPQP
jgi:Right handed beta helix region